MALVSIILSDSLTASTKKLYVVKDYIKKKIVNMKREIPESLAPSAGL